MCPIPRWGLGYIASGPVPTPGGTFWPQCIAVQGPGSLFVTEPREADQHPALASHSFSLTAPSSHQHRHTAGEKHTKELGGKGKKNRNLKIGRITVSEKWRESVFRKITNANELKYLDEFLLNKVGLQGEGGIHWVGRGLQVFRPGPPQEGHHHPAVF